MDEYRHTQAGTVVLGALAVSVVVGAAILLWAVPGQRGTLAVLAVPLVITTLFHSLTVRIRDGALRVAFGPGLIGFKVRLVDIEGCEPVTNPWWYGWGIHRTPRGWLHNVSGNRAVELRLTNGKLLRIGTDEPEKLCAAIAQAKERLRTPQPGGITPRP